MYELLQQFQTVISQIDASLPELSNYITTFIFTEAQYNVKACFHMDDFSMSVDVPVNMPDVDVEFVRNRLGILDNLIHIKSDQTRELIRSGADLENRIILNNPEYESILRSRMQEFRRILTEYRHH